VKHVLIGMGYKQAA